MDKYDWIICIGVGGWMLWFARELGFIRLPAWGAARLMRQRADAASQVNAKQALMIIKAQIAASADAGGTGVHIAPEVFAWDRAAAAICARQLRRDGYRVDNRCGSRLWSFVVSWR